MGSGPKWTSVETLVLEKLHGQDGWIALTVAELAAKGFRRNKEGVRRKALALGLSVPKVEHKASSMAYTRTKDYKIQKEINQYLQKRWIKEDTK